jgi:hypothetical protein
MAPVPLPPSTEETLVHAHQRPNDFCGSLPRRRILCQSRGGPESAHHGYRADVSGDADSVSATPLSCDLSGLASILWIWTCGC